ncbi:glycogen synthase GlgA [Acidihalobacter prosperus]|uniref:Glycogen synthase n=1 Tax=Acidihalobacter prosperus TaxID=160660 RepID=A0A1A6C2I7_9GAMM|nr:glycogen synthase GlgA [Acidihalobacter prosperus]OBS08768.1 Glycogen synthase, ADP-glucose transglucosylase [Acidihalobacter prosperus]
MRILFASSEAHPLIKTGGLADVSGSLPAALAALGHDVRLILPAYPAVRRQGRWQPLNTPAIDGAPTGTKLLSGTLPGTRLRVYLVDAPPYFERAGDPYRAPDGRDWQDNHLRFGLFGRVIAALGLNQAGLRWRPDVVHCNDWQTGLVPALLQGHPERPATVFTIHNLAYQGLFPAETLQALDLPEALWRPEALEFYGQLSFIKGGLVFADRITTVSPTYAREIRTPRFGYGLDGLLEHRAAVLSGILNGIDDDIWNPHGDRHLPASCDPTEVAARRRCRAQLCATVGLDDAPDAPPLLGHIGRLVEQKGTDLILAALEPLLAQGRVRAVILGSGERRFEQALTAMAGRHPERLAVRVGYDETLAHHIEAGADAFLMPSRFEPCGLNQMYSLRYGTPPLAHRTGGLADTVVDASPDNLAAGIANGFLFDTPSVKAFEHGLGRLLELWGTPAWETLIRVGTQTDFSWTHSAQQYSNLYKSISYQGHA